MGAMVIVANESFSVCVSGQQKFKNVNTAKVSRSILISVLKGLLSFFQLIFFIIGVVSIRLTRLLIIEVG